MAGKVVQEPAQGTSATASTLRPPTAADGAVLLQVMAIIHQEPLSSAFGKLQRNTGDSDELLPILHFFEEVGALVLHQLLSQELLFDAFAIDVYWQRLRPSVLEMRAITGNDKFGENFELVAELAVDYRQRRPAKLHQRAAI